MNWPTPTEALVLHEILKLGESYGLEIVKHSSVPRGSVYVVLGRLEEKGFVVSRQEDSPSYIGIPRRLYKATALGRKLRQALNELSKSYVSASSSSEG